MPTVCVCGGGSGAHVLAGLAARCVHINVFVLTMFRDCQGGRAGLWNKLMKENDLIVERLKPDGDVEEIRSRPMLVTHDPAQVVPMADVIVFCAPAFTHECYFKAILPYLRAGTSIVGLPGQPGFEFQCLAILKDKVKQCAVLSYDSLPWVCRLEHFGQKVTVLGTKHSLVGSKISGHGPLTVDPEVILQTILGKHPKLKKASNYLVPTLMTKSIIHPPVLFARWGNWDGQPITTKPLFYQGIDETAAANLSKVSEEILDIAYAITRQKPQLAVSPVQHILDWYRTDYYRTVTDPTSLYTAMKTNTAYNDLEHPLKETSPGQWVLDTGCRYLTEDVPYGLVVLKGLAQLAGVATPEIDRELSWCQEQMGKEYILGSELKGKDVPSSRAPQAYGLNSLDDLVLHL